jgi:imidazole glycerol-phosphate synthase subunit HisF
MPTLLFKEVGLVKGVGFDSWRRVGPPMQAVKVYNLRQVDELVFLDIAATPNGALPDFAQVDELADQCFMPMTVGGGVRSVEDIRQLLAVGADKVAINTAALAAPGLIAKGAAQFGSQCITVSIDALRHADGRLEVMACCGREPTGRDPVAWAREAERLGAGEILLGSVDRDGTMGGYDLPLIRAVTATVGIPVIASGGAGSYGHLAQAIVEGGADAVAAASIFHFTEMTPREAKQYLAAQGLPVRL